MAATTVVAATEPVKTASRRKLPAGVSAAGNSPVSDGATTISLEPTPSDGSLDQSAATGLSRADRLQPLLLVGSIAAGLGLAQLAPGVARSLTPLVSVGVLLLIFLVMLGVDVKQVAQALGQRRFLALAITINFVVNPLLAAALGALFLRGEPDLRVGLILFLVTPCIGWYLIFTELAGGDAALAVSLLGINLVLQVLLLPLYLLVFAGQGAGVDGGEIILSVLTFLVVPAVAASVVRRLVQPPRLERFVDVTGRVQLKTVVLSVVIVAMFASQSDVLLDNPGVVARLLPPMIGFFAIAFVVAMVAGRTAGLAHDQVAALVFTATSRNSEASLAIAATAFASPLVALTVVVGPVIELPLLVLMVRLLLTRRAG